MLARIHDTAKSSWEGVGRPCETGHVGLSPRRQTSVFYTVHLFAPTQLSMKHRFRFGVCACLARFLPDGGLTSTREDCILYFRVSSEHGQGHNAEADGKHGESLQARAVSHLASVHLPEISAGKHM